MHEGGILALAVREDGRCIVNGGWDGHVAVLDNDGVLHRRLNAGDAPIVAVAFHSRGKRLATCSRDGDLRLFDTASWREIFRVPVELLALADDPSIAKRAFSTGLAFSPDGRELAVSREDGRPIVFRADFAASQQMAPVRGR